MNEYLNLKEAAKILGFKSHKSVSYHIGKGSLVHSKKVKGKWLVSKENLESFLDELNNKEYFTLKEAQKKLGYKSNSSVRKLIDNGSLINSKKVKGKWLVFKDELKSFLDQSSNKEYFTLKEAAQILGYKSSQSVIKLIDNGSLINSKKVKGKWLIFKNELESFLDESNNEEYFTVKEAQEILGYKFSVTVRKLIDRGSLVNSKKVKGRWLISKNELESFIDESKNKEYLTLKEAAKILNEKPEHLASLCKKGGTFPNAVKNTHLWEIPMIDIIEYQAKLEATAKNDYYTRLEITKLLGIHGVSVTNLIKKGVLSKNIKKVNGRFQIPKEDVDMFLEKQRTYYEQYISLKEAASKINKNLTAIVQRVEKYFPNAVKNLRGNWIVPYQDIQNYLEGKNQDKLYDSSVALRELLIFINDFINDFKYKETLNLYKEFIRIQFNKMNGTTSYIRDREGIYRNLFMYLKDNLINEIYLLEVNEIENLLNKSISKTRKMLIPRFINYCYSVKGIENEEKIVIDLSKRNKNDTIYSPVIFNEIYLYVKNKDLHKNEAIENQNYANMWAYTLLLITDFIRGADLILQTPIINIEDLAAKSLIDLNSTELTLKESHMIINQLYIHFRNKRASKNKELLTFIVSPDLVIPLAHALVISEMHRQKNNDTFLLNSFVSNSMFKNTHTSGLSTHKKFSNKSALPSEFKFHSQTMNRSVATYLFFSIVEEDAANADLALTLTQNSRSHVDTNSTAIYIQLTNKDGYINRVSINLFRRGYFGWLYNYLILFAQQGENVNHTLEERTIAIEELRKGYSPGETEEIAQMFLDYTSTGDIESFIKESDTDNYSKILTEIYSKSNSVIERLNKYSKDEIKKILVKLAKGQLPSKNEYGQCLIHPACEYPLVENCFKCEYFIPQYLILIELKQELNKIMDLIHESNNVIMIQKHTYFLKHYLFIWKEVRVAYGEDVTSAYLPKEQITFKLEKIAHKLVIE
ncbi:helix-turn-helix domain-containing protein [Solibacillus cecembensis]|uniref:helix-turn-helix domain-containing protein n=1 Tax=Solibacillus cecembensis TaxID=459347 RepID=UPI003CFC618B